MTKQPKFTPGPWKYANDTDFPEIQNTDPCNPCEVCYIDDRTDEQEAAANAALIAQCPSLYENEERNLKALKKLLGYYENIDLNRHSEECRMVANGIMSDLKDLIVTTEKLLAKCRGENTDGE